jgi:hypothetical protein
MSAQAPSHLLSLPAELQLLIYEFAVTEQEVLLVNCGCDSSYSFEKIMYKYEPDKLLWSTGERHAPLQPVLTRTCRSIRLMSLPMFYELNTFKAHYCHGAVFSEVEDWLNAIGGDNRALLKNFFLFDRNPRQDYYSPRDIKSAERILKNSFGARIKSAEAENGGCYYRVFFGECEVEGEDIAKLFKEWS